MKNRKAKKMPSIITPVILAIAAATWVITACVHLVIGELPWHRLALHCATAIVFCWAAVANYIGYKRSNDDNKFQ